MTRQLLRKPKSESFCHVSFFNNADQGYLPTRGQCRFLVKSVDLTCKILVRTGSVAVASGSPDGTDSELVGGQPQGNPKWLILS